MKLRLGTVLVLAAALVGAPAVAQDASPEASPMPAMAQPAECPAVVAELDALVAALESDAALASDAVDWYRLTPAARDARWKARRAVAALADDFALAVEGLEFPADWQAGADALVVAALAESAALAAGEGHTTLPRTGEAIWALREAFALEPGCEVGPVVFDPTARTAARDMLCSVLVQVPEVEGSSIREEIQLENRYYRKIPKRHINDVRSAVRSFFRKHGKKTRSLDLSDEAIWGPNAEWKWSRKLKRREVDRYVKQMAKGDWESQGATEDLMTLFFATYAASDDRGLRKDARKVVANAYAYGARNLRPRPKLFWFLITRNLNASLPYLLELERCPDD